MRKIKNKFKETEIGKIPEDRAVKELEKLSEVKTGKGTKKLDLGKYSLIGSSGFLGLAPRFKKGEIDTSFIQNL